MGVITTTDEYACSIPPKRMFKAFILDADNLIPKLMPNHIKSIEVVEGDGGAGSIKQTNLAEGSHYKYMKHKFHLLDGENCCSKYTLVEGDMLGDVLESIDSELKLEAAGTGSVCKVTTHYHTKAGVELKEEEIKAGKDKAMGMFKVVEDYLVANPDAYA